MRPRCKKTHGKNWDFPERLIWGSLKIVGIADRLVGDNPDEILEKRGFSLFCHEYLLVIGYKDEGWEDVTRGHADLQLSSSHPLKPQGLNNVLQSHGGECPQQAVLPMD